MAIFLIAAIDLPPLGPQRRHVVGEFFDLALARDNFELPARRGEAGVVVHAAELVDLKRLLLQQLLGLAELFGQVLQLVFASAQFGPHLAGLSLQLRQRFVPFAALRHEPLQLFAVAVDLDDLARGLFTESLEADFETARRHRELRPHAVLVRLDLGQRQRHRGLDALARQRDGPPPDRRRDDQGQKPGGQETEDEEQAGLHDWDLYSGSGRAQPAIG